MTGRGRADAPVFRPVRGTWIAGVLGVAVTLGGIALAVALPGDQFGVMDRLIAGGIGIAAGIFLSRFATIHARPEADGLWVRNLGPGERVPWEDIEAIRFSQGMPFPRLDLSNGMDMTLMAIQRSDGERSVQEAQRLADLIGR